MLVYRHLAKNRQNEFGSNHLEYTIYFVQKHAFDYLDAPIHRINSMDVPLPYAPTLIQAILPNVERTVKAVKAVMYR